MKMITNYFRLKRAPMWTLHEYHVEIEPECDARNARKALVRQEQERLGAYIFDGTKMYTSHKLDPSPYKFEATIKEGTFKVTVIFHFTLDAGDPTYMHFYHLILRRCLFGMELEEMGRNFFDHKAAIEIKAHRLALWPGNNILLIYSFIHPSTIIFVYFFSFHSIFI